MAFGAWFRVNDATLLLTVRVVRNAPRHRPPLLGMLLPAEHDEPNGQEPGFYEVQDEPPDPIDVSLLGPDAEAQPPNDVADLIGSLG